jgi:integrase
MGNTKDALSAEGKAPQQPPVKHERKRRKLSKKALEEVAPWDAECVSVADRYILWGSDGLYAEVMSSGQVTFRYRYRLPTGKREKVTLGPYPALSLREATKMHLQLRSQVALGRSPLAERKALHDKDVRSNSFAALAEDWVEKVLRPVNKNSRQDQTYLTRDILPSLGNMPIASVSRADLWECIEVVRGRGHSQAARRVQSVLKRVFDYAVTRGMTNSNPAVGIRPSHIAPARRRDRVLSLSELPVWVHAIETSRLSKPLKLALRLLLLVPVRKGELLRARWEHLNFRTDTWHLPKENAKNKAAITHRLTPQTKGIFEELKVLASGSVWVLPSSRNYGRQPIAAATLNSALRGVEGLPPGVVVHDLRRTVRTYLTELGVPTNVAELCLNHRPAGVVAVYDHAELLDARYEALAKWERHLSNILSGHPEKATDDIADEELEQILTKVRADERLRRLVLSKLLSG